MREKEAERTLKIYRGEFSHTEKTHQGMLRGSTGSRTAGKQRTITSVYGYKNHKIK